MADRSNDMSALLREWTDAQMKLWDVWRGPPSPPRGEEGYQRMLATCEELTRAGVSAPARLGRAWTEVMSSMDGVPDGARESARQAQEVLDGWAQVSDQMCTHCFDTARAMHPARAMELWNGTFGLMRSWTEGLGRAQTEYARAAREMPEASRPQQTSSSKKSSGKEASAA
jgi:cytosine/adenosine deaminase-related metal-dependent hydrolase